MARLNANEIIVFGMDDSDGNKRPLISEMHRLCFGIRKSLTTIVSTARHDKFNIHCRQLVDLFERDTEISFVVSKCLNHHLFDSFR